MITILSKMANASVGEDSEELDEDDLDLITESTGRKRHPRLQRLRRYSNSPPAASSSKRAVIDSSEDDLDEAANAEDIHNIWDDEERRDGEGDPEDEDLDDFIDWEDEEEGGVGQDDISREERRKQKQRRDDERRKIRSLHPNTLGIDAKCTSLSLFSSYAYFAITVLGKKCTMSLETGTTTTSI